MRWRRQAFYVAAGLILLSPLEAPQLLAFPYVEQIGTHRIYSEVPIEPELKAVVRAGDALAAHSSIADADAHQAVFLTNGGWRWAWLTLTFGGAFAISRPGSEVIIVNRSNPAADAVFTPRNVGGKRALSATLAHEMTHGAIRKHFGMLADWRYPTWLREGYCDYVAGGSSLTDAEAKRLTASGTPHPALVYWRGRKRVESELERNGGSVDGLFARLGA
ncbi:hypothetical protein [Sphingomonas agri]|uniref:hypothetical protein n=1 Tax=Sphingomonas agri TaxID=1813878 RepID=UPI0031203347